MKEQIKQGRQKILLLFEGSSEKIKVKEIRNVPYKNRALQELEQEQKLQKKDDFYFLTELGRKELKKNTGTAVSNTKNTTTNTRAKAITNK